MEPYVVQSVTDSDGNVISYHEPTEVRQVISEETSATVRSILESVVNDTGGTGKNAKVDGYRIGGKTGSSQNTDSDDHIIVSFLGFAPADDPQVIVLLAYDWPQPAVSGGNTTAGGTYISGGNMAAPMAGELIANILDYLGYQKTGSDSSSAVTVPNLTGSDLDKAQSRLTALGLNYKTSGDGTVVTGQAPSGGSSIPAGSTVVLYMGTERPDETVAMPDLTGMTYAQAMEKMESLGLYINATGVEGGTVFVQTVEPGALVEVGTVVEVKFVDSTDLDDEGNNDVPFKEED
jgi:stage V sporulation protein D (sporulation-specific penicillin-binding protein)